MWLGKTQSLGVGRQRAFQLCSTTAKSGSSGSSSSAHSVFTLPIRPFTAFTLTIMVRRLKSIRLQRSANLADAKPRTDGHQDHGAIRIRQRLDRRQAFVFPKNDRPFGPLADTLHMDQLDRKS